MKLRAEFTDAEIVDLTICIGEVTGGGVAVIRGNDQAPSSGEALNEGPKVITGKLLRSVLGQQFQTLARAVVVQFGVWPVMPKHPVLSARGAAY